MQNQKPKQPMLYEMRNKKSKIKITSSSTMDSHSPLMAVRESRLYCHVGPGSLVAALPVYPPLGEPLAIPASSKVMALAH